MDYTYTYNLSQFPYGKYDISRIDKDIRNSAIRIALDYINSSSSQVDLYFKSELSESEELILDQIISTHSGEPLPENLVQQVKIAVEQPKYIDSGNVTQELFCAESITMDISSGDIYKYQDYSWPFNIALKSATIFITDEMVGDEMHVKIAPNTIIGASIQNLNVGDTSIYVSPTVIQNIKYGRYIGFPTLNKELGRVVTIGTNYLTFYPAADVSVDAGTYIGMCAKIIPYAYFSSRGIMEIGKTITTADRIPANTKIRLEYKNNTGTAKKISFFLEYLY